MSVSDFLQPLERLTSGVAGLDRILGGGFFGGGVYIVEGVPGSGKTILANQICFHQVKSGQRALYLTLLAESHARLLQHLQAFSFFDPSAIPDRLTYVSGFAALQEAGLDGLLDLVRREVRAQRATVVVLDGFGIAAEVARSDREFKTFIHELQVHAALLGGTTFLLSTGSGDANSGAVHPIHTMVDGLVRVTDRLFGARAQRELHVQKFRGSAYLRGVHSFVIDDDGVQVHPRLESFSADPADASGLERTSVGVDGIDAMLGGGVRRGSSTMVMGPTGVGKTILGYRFLAASHRDEKGVLFSFYETPHRAFAKAGGIGTDLAQRCESGDLELVWQSPVEGTLDAIGGRILQIVDRARARRLFIDGFNALQYAAAYPERVSQFFAALGRELQARSVTMFCSAELPTVFGPEIEAPARGISPLVENLILLRFVEVHSQLRRVISVLKLRDGGFDTRLREFVISDHGLHVDGVFSHTEGVLTGTAHDEPRGGAKGATKGRQTSKRSRRPSAAVRSTRPAKRRG